MPIYTKTADGWVEIQGTNTPPAPTYNEATGGVESIVDDYNGTGQRWKVHVFEVDTAPAVLTVTGSSGPFTTLVVAGGNGVGYFGGKVTSGGEVVENELTLAVGDSIVTVGDGGYNPDPGKDGVGGQSIFGGITASPSGTPGDPVPSNITGTEIQYGGNGNTSGTRGRGSVGVAGRATKGQPGIVVVAYQISDTDATVRGHTQGEITRKHYQLPVIEQEYVEVTDE